jgi:hypothetical protein
MGTPPLERAVVQHMAQFLKGENMTTKFAIINPATGNYEFVATESELVETIATMAFEFFLSHTHGNPVSFVEVLEDGSEVWRNTDNQIIRNPTQAAEMRRVSGQYVGSIPTTQV